MMYQGKNIKIADHPLGIIVQQEWDKWLEKLGYPKDINVYELPEYDYKFICVRIDRATENWFENASYVEFQNLRNAWNYQGRHLIKEFRKVRGYKDE